MAISSLPSSMRAWTFSKSGDPERVLSLNTSHPRPRDPTGSSLLIHISHTALSSAGVNLMHDLPSFLRKIAVPELDFSGEVVQTGPSAPSQFAQGTRVFGSVPPSVSIFSGTGALAEYVVVPSDYVRILPAKMRFEEAAGLCCLAQTAQKMVETASIASGHRVLVHGASGGIGLMAVQLARAAGGTIVATCSKRNFEMVKRAGADEVVDYTANAPLNAYLGNNYSHQPFDTILDTVGSQDLYSHSPGYLKSTGIYVSVGTSEDKQQGQTFWRWIRNSILPTFLGGTPRQFCMFGAQITPHGVGKLGEAAEKGQIQVVVDSVFGMNDALAAYKRLKSRQAQGKVVVDVRTHEGGHSD